MTATLVNRQCAAKGCSITFPSRNFRHQFCSRKCARREAQRRFREKNPDRSRAIQRRFRENHPERVREDRLRRRAANIDKTREIHREECRRFRENSPGKVLASNRRYREKHASKLKEKNTLYKAKLRRQRRLKKAASRTARILLVVPALKDARGGEQ